MNTAKLRELLDDRDRFLGRRAEQIESKDGEILREVERLLAGAQDATVPASRHPAHRQPKGGAR